MKSVHNPVATLLFLIISSGVFHFAWAHETDTEAESEAEADPIMEVQAPVFNHQYLMKDSPASEDHFEESNGQKWKLQIKFRQGSWSAHDQGVKAGGTTSCQSASTCNVLKGSAEVKGCRHTIEVTPDGASFEVAGAIWVELGKAEECQGHLHKHTGEIHGGTAHGTG